MDKSEIKDNARRILDPAISGLASLGISPLLVSVFGLVFSIYGAFVLARGSLLWGGIWLIISGLCDVLDGSLARRRGVESRFGAFIDSTFDRISELAYLSGLIIYYIHRPEGPSTFMIVLICIVLSASILISYARARLEGLGFRCTVGLMERPERLTLLIVGLIFGERILPAVLILLAVGTVFTVFQRIHHAYQVTSDDATGIEIASGDTLEDTANETE
jgi:CDP-diacylglycerol--glycerol-3-phosphate 3-phosphatidyltransferase